MAFSSFVPWQGETSNCKPAVAQPSGASTATSSLSAAQIRKPHWKVLLFFWLFALSSFPSSKHYQFWFFFCSVWVSQMRLTDFKKNVNYCIGEILVTRWYLTSIDQKPCLWVDEKSIGVSRNIVIGGPYSNLLGTYCTPWTIPR